MTQYDVSSLEELHVCTELAGTFVHNKQLINTTIPTLILSCTSLHIKPVYITDFACSCVVMGQIQNGVLQMNKVKKRLHEIYFVTEIVWHSSV